MGPAREMRHLEGRPLLQRRHCPGLLPPSLLSSCKAALGPCPSSADPATVKEGRQNRVRAFTSPSQWPPRHHGESQRETPNKRGQQQHPGQLKDTVPTNEEDDEVDADDHPRR